MAARMVVLYATPKDVPAFDAHYNDKHIPLAKKIPGLQKFELSKGPIFSPTGASGFHAVATLHFADLGAIQAGLMSPEGQIAAGDAMGLMAEGSKLLFFETTEV